MIFAIAVVSMEGTDFVYTFRSPELSQGKLNKDIYTETKTGIKIHSYVQFELWLPKA
jgi:hypothetical protein